MAPKKKSLVWKFYDRIDDNKSKCKLCQIVIKCTGNTTNLFGHIRNVHKAAYIEIVPFQRTTSEKESITQSVLEPAASSSNETPCIGSVDELKSNQSDSETVIPSTSSSQSTSKPLDKALDSDSEVIPIKRQKSIKTSFQEISSYSESGMKTRKLNNCLLYMICKDHQPFSIVENEGFKNLMKSVAPQDKIPSRTSLRRWLDNKYEVVSETFKKKLSSIEDLTLTTDIWSDTLNMKSFIGVTVHFGIEIELISVTLGVYELDERHTSQYISEMLLKTCAEWGTKKDNVTAVVTDNAANMVKAVELTFGKKKHIPCLAHSLNLVAEGTMACTVWQEIVTKIKAIVTWFKQSCVASDELRKATSTETKLIQSVPTRWNSTYYMVQRFLELRSVINDILFRHATAPPMLSSSEISIASSVLLILRPLEVATKEISADKYCTTSKIIPLVRCIFSKITSAGVAGEPVAREVQKLALQEITKRMGSIEHVTPLAIANILDPRFKKNHINDAIACSNAVSKIKDLMKIHLRQIEEIESDSDKSDKSEETFSLWSDGTSQTVYLTSPVGRLNDNPLEIWKDYKIQFPILHKIAFKYLIMVGTSVPSERLFSQAAQVMTQQRNRLKDKRLENATLPRNPFFMIKNKKVEEDCLQLDESL
ncbi:E3 SUMO-protein ligase ZBED1-like [Lycorma delicatula]|uniref:E3 SUMO-protein ligase ZBED1-like n=1 Tax=Lycorma delicatula TaxID=130591 RepID=UPI003F517AB8